VYLLDSNIYIRAFTRGGEDPAFRAFHQAALPRLILSAVVVHELLVGAQTPAHRRQVERGLIEPFRSRRRVHAPTLGTWALAAQFDRDLRGLGMFSGSLAQRSFANDLLLAATARELGATIVTHNLADFELIGRVTQLKAVGPWPSAT
jgi:predicted nucleic acid-binding protein